jgi:hypothetical protein
MRYPQLDKTWRKQSWHIRAANLICMERLKKPIKSISINSVLAEIRTEYLPSVYSNTATLTHSVKISYLKIQPYSTETPCVSVTRSSRLMLLKEIMFVYCDTKHKNILCGKNAGFLSVKAVHRCSNHCVLNC